MGLDSVNWTMVVGAWRLEEYDIGSIMGWIKSTMEAFGIFGLFQTALAIVIIIAMVSLVLRLVSGSRG